MPLDILRFSTQRPTKLVMFPTRLVPESLMNVTVKLESDRTRIEVRTERLQPAVLFGGDVTCYVLWSISRGSVPLNLGELWVEPGKEKEKFDFTTSLKNFALIVTGETYSMVEQPSDLVVFWNDRVTEPQVQSDNITFNGFTSGPAKVVSELRSTNPHSSKPAELIQAEVTYQAALSFNAQSHAPPEFAQASIFLDRARKSVSNEKELKRFARSSFMASSQALAKSTRKTQLLKLQQEMEKARSGIVDLESRLEKALSENQVQRETVSELQSVNNRALMHARELEEQREGFRKTTADLEARLSGLRREKQQLETGLESVQQEHRSLQGQLHQALSFVAETQQTNRGFLIKLPDILFDVGRDSLKQDAKIVLAKLVGILLIMQEQNLRIEGHTDSTGSTKLNLELSQRRALAVADFLQNQGITSTRMKTEGYGKQRPIADNRTANGRKQNRRVEIIIAEGEISEVNP